MPIPHPATLDNESLRRQCQVRRERRSGPGGQHRNKVETAIVLQHEPTGITAEANERRSQAQNLQVAIHRLRVNLALGVRSAIDETNVSNELWGSRCRNKRIAVNPEHEDFPSLLSHALDVVERCQFDLKAAAAKLECTASQLTKLFKLEPRAFQKVNQQRAERGLHVLK